jgi:hypothetical protein
MPASKRRHSPRSLPRRLITDLMHFSQQVPNVDPANKDDQAAEFVRR